MKRSVQSGFTVLEILVVLTIMGFLIAMVAPRLAGLSGGAIDTICDTNQNRMVGYMAQYYESASRYPTNLTNLVIEDSTNGFLLPEVSDDNPENGNEVLASELQDRMQLTTHKLTQDEIDELVGLGISQIFNLNDYSNSGVAAADMNPAMESVDLTSATDVTVAMVGLGSDGAGVWTLTPGMTERGLGEPDWFGRIVLGFSAESGLIKDGIIANAAHCPGGLQNADNASYNDYNVVLPRLEATAAEMVDAAGVNVTGIGGNTVGTDNGEVVAVAYDDEPAVTYNLGTNDENLRVRTFNIIEAQEPWQFATVCPEGHMYPEDDNEFWAADIDNSGIIE